jgi:Tfp pilus assembly protein PilN
MTPLRLELDYVAAPSAPRWIGISVLVLALAVAGSLVLRYSDTRHQLAALDAAHGLLNADRRPARAVPKERLEQEAKIIDAAVRQLTLPWAQMIEAVEAASSSDVVVLQLQPEAQQRTLRLTAEAKNGEAMLRYVRRLGENRVLSAVYLASHQVQMEDPSRPIQFSVQASFRSAR